jgi:hypothetical protein
MCFSSLFTGDQCNAYPRCRHKARGHGTIRKTTVMTLEAWRAAVAADRRKDLESDLVEAMTDISEETVQSSGVRDVMDALQGKSVPGRRDARVWLSQIERIARVESRCPKAVPVVYST